MTATGVFAGGSPLVFEGATANDFETTFAITDPTSDRTITFQDAHSGTVAYLTDITEWWWMLLSSQLLQLIQALYLRILLMTQTKQL